MPERAKTQRSSSQSTSMSSLLHYLALFLPALLPLPSLGLYSGDTDFFETSGGELQNDAHAPDHKWLSIARQLRRDIASARDEQFEMAFGGIRNMTEFATMRLETPQLNSSDGCLPFHFNGQKCLQRIYSGLRIYHVYLAYLEQESRSVANMVDIILGTSRLLHFIKETVKVNEDKIHPTDLSKFTDTVWNQKLITHSVLYNFANFMTDVSRGINYMKMKKLTKHAVKEDEWLSKHQQ